jgi:hypothetical protein
MRAKSAMLGVAAAAAFSSAAIASPCVKTSLTKYTAAGFSCTISDKTFSGFIYTSNLGAFPASTVSVIPLPGTGNPGIVLDNLWNITTAGKSSDFSVIFKVAAPKTNLIEDASLSLTGTAKTGGFVIDSEDILSGGVKIANVTASITAGHNVAGNVTFAPVASITVEEDIALRGFETLSLVDKHFSEQHIPEPTSLALIGVGLTALGLARRRKSKSRPG